MFRVAIRRLDYFHSEDVPFRNAPRCMLLATRTGEPATPNQKKTLPMHAFCKGSMVHCLRKPGKRWTYFRVLLLFAVYLQSTGFARALIRTLCKKGWFNFAVPHLLPNANLMPHGWSSQCATGSCPLLYRWRKLTAGVMVGSLLGLAWCYIMCVTLPFYHLEGYY